MNWLDQIKLKAGCARCGYNEYACALDFNHVRGEKSFNIAPNWGRSLQALKEELAKCEVLCANCHRVYTHMKRLENGEARLPVGRLDK